MERELADQKARVLSVLHGHHQHRGGDVPMVVTQVRGERGETGQTGQKGETGPVGPTGPPGQTPDIAPVIEQLTAHG